MPGPYLDELVEAFRRLLLGLVLPEPGGVVIDPDLPTVVEHVLGAARDASEKEESNRGGGE